MTKDEEKAVRDAAKVLDEMEFDLTLAEERLARAREALASACKRAEVQHEAVCVARRALDEAIKKATL